MAVTPIDPVGEAVVYGQQGQFIRTGHDKIRIAMEDYYYLSETGQLTSAVEPLTTDSEDT